MCGKIVFRIQISKDNLGSVAGKLLAIWKDAMPNIEPAPDSIIYRSNLTSLIPKQKRALTLSDLRNMNFTRKKLRAILHLGNYKIIIRKWKELLVYVARFGL
ncbi:MAG: hypothetical protein NZ927_00985 [Candidatus Calescibacterium sp.]|nr:hypothetical protein [Candidatus Calescibacterium sp.]MCX7733713.1 hypothetical protein [bacterium]MDW8087503.1 hypothetical protein [Candidatus Calescibacterium sp.]